MLDIRPTKIVAVGRNYVAHARDLGHAVPTEPLISLRPGSSIVGEGDAVVYPAQTQTLHHEAGYTCANDVTARDLQQTDDQWTPAKDFDTFCPLGPRVVADLEPGVGAVQRGDTMEVEIEGIGVLRNGVR